MAMPRPENQGIEELRAQARAANALGNKALASGRTAEARGHFEVATAADPGQPALLFNLAAACKSCGDPAAALAALDAALVADPYFVQAMFQKALLFDEAGDAKAAAGLFRDFLDTVPPEVESDARFAAPLEHARRVVKADQLSLAERIDAAGPTPSRRIAATIAHLTGQAPAYRSEPTFLTVPELPAVPFLDRAATPWLDRLETEWESIRDEAMAAFDAGVVGFVPYVANPTGTPLNQWRELDHNTDWSAFFFWRHGTRHEDNCSRLPRTAAILETMPLLDIARRGPNAFLSRLAPKVRIPPHHGVTNARLTVHLPLIVPEGCGFRVGGVKRQWVPGCAWVFDDTIEHEAWNDSSEPRLILIFDIWNPLLGADECVHLREVLRAYDAHSGREPLPGDEF